MYYVTSLYGKSTKFQSFMTSSNLPEGQYNKAHKYNVVKNNPEQYLQFLCQGLGVFTSLYLAGIFTLHEHLFSSAAAQQPHGFQNVPPCCSPVHALPGRSLSHFLWLLRYCHYALSRLDIMSLHCLPLYPYGTVCLSLLHFLPYLPHKQLPLSLAMHLQSTSVVSSPVAGDVCE